MSQVLEKTQDVSNDESDETDSIYENENNGEHSENGINLSNESDAATSYNTINDNIPFMNRKSTHRSAKIRNSI